MSDFRIGEVTNLAYRFRLSISESSATGAAILTSNRWHDGQKVVVHLIQALESDAYIL